MFSSNATQASNLLYIENVFSTYVYSGNSATFPVVNGIDLSTYGGMLWTKNRTSAYVGQIYNSSVGLTNYLVPSTTAANASTSGIAFNTNGFTLGSNDNSNATGQNGVGWTFREQPKFFDVVTFTSNSSGGVTSLAHSLGSTPGAIFIKRTDVSGGQNWLVYHRSLTTPTNYYLALNTIIMVINFQIQFSYFRYYVFLGCTSHFLCLFFLSLAEIVPYLF
jgi:hypothetical protein